MRFGRLGRSFLREAGQPILHVCGVADLARFAVADHVDAEFNLPPHDVGDILTEGVVEFRCGDCDSRFLFLQKLKDGGAPRQAADMRRQDAVLTGLHLFHALTAFSEEAPCSMALIDSVLSVDQSLAVIAPKRSSATMVLSRERDQPVATMSMNRPGRADITATRSDSMAASSRACVMSTTVAPVSRQTRNSSSPISKRVC